MFKHVHKFENKNSQKYFFGANFEPAVGQFF